MQGKRVVVTGAASGIGRASVVRFASAGAFVVAVDVNAKGLAETDAAVRAADGACKIVEASAADEGAMKQIVDDCVSEHGGLDVMFANAGILLSLSPLDVLSVDEFRKVLEVNLLGPFVAIREASRVMKDAGGGSIVCTASVAGLRSGAGPMHYSASKAAVINLVQTAAYQLSGTGVRVNAICPGLVETGMTKVLYDIARAKGTERKIGQLNPTQRGGEPEEIAEVAFFLGSDASSYINGQAIAVDGGLSASHPYKPGSIG